MNSLISYGHIAQSVVQHSVKVKVIGSSPVMPAILDRGRKSIKSKTLVDDPILIFK